MDRICTPKASLAVKVVHEPLSLSKINTLMMETGEMMATMATIATLATMELMGPWGVATSPRGSTSLQGGGATIRVSLRFGSENPQ